MSESEIERLWAKALAGEKLEPDEERDLVNLLRGADVLREELLEDHEIHRLLQGSARSDREAAAFERALLRGLAASKDETGFINRVDSKIREAETREPRPGSRRIRLMKRSEGPRFLIPAIVAAGVLLAFGVVLIPPSRPQTSREEVRAPKPAPPVAPAPVEDRKPPREPEKRVEPPAPQPPVPRVETPRVKEPVEPLPRKPRELEAPPAPEPPRPAPPEVPAPEPKTVAALAQVDLVEGEAHLLGEGERKPLVAGQAILAGRGIETGSGARAVLLSADQTRLEFGPDTKVGAITEPRGKRVQLERGTVLARVARQVPGKPLVFATPHGEATVVGTTLRLSVAKDSTRLEVTEGKVQLKNLAGKTSEVSVGHYAVAAAGVEMTARALPIDDVVLVPKHAKIAGEEWRLAKDPQAPGGTVLESAIQLWRPFPSKETPDYLRRFSSHVTFTFQADADKDYNLWIRGKYLPVIRKDGGHGSVAVEAPTGRFTGRCPWFSQTGESGFMFDFFSNRAGYWWVGGNEQASRIGTAIRFAKSGTQVLRLYGTEPLLIDCLWLSAVQKTRPDDNAKVPNSDK